MCDRIIMGVCRGFCFIFMAEFIAAIIKEKEGIGVFVLSVLVVSTAFYGWYDA